MRISTNLLTFLFACFALQAIADTKVSGILQDCKVIPDETIVVDVEAIKELCFAKKVVKIEWKSGFDNFVLIKNEDAEKIPKNYIDAGVLGVIRIDANKYGISSNIYITFDDNTRIERIVKTESHRLKEGLAKTIK